MTVTCNVDGISFEMRNQQDFSFLAKYGKVFQVFSEQDSGNIAFSTQLDDRRYFIKVAGMPTLQYSGSPHDAVVRLQDAMSIYEQLHHPFLVQLIEHYKHAEFYIAVFEWAEGDCLHAHWNFEDVPKYTHTASPYFRYKQLPLEKRLHSLDTIYTFLQYITDKGYVAIDVYDGSLMYNFDLDVTTICDIDLFERTPYMNDMGRMWGSSRFMSPEEYELGATIDEVTNVYLLGALAFMLLGDDRDRSLEKWRANEHLYAVAAKATNKSRSERHATICEFIEAWEDAKLFESI